MKNIFLAGIIFATFSFQIMAQVDHDYNPNDVVPVEGKFLTNDQVPAVVREAMEKDFSLDKPETWTKFPYALKEYGFVYDKGAANVKPDRYEVHLKTSDGIDMFAVYSNEGVLIATKEVFPNVDLPASVKEKLANSNYKDWKVIGSKEIIRYYHDKKKRRTTLQGDSVKW